ncbi:aminotransferase class I/II-fold pyridoxal phosphate-dependent enzyme [Treponema parvum]|uniref:Aminotransferase class I/II-fold pyridoxal phosphate-dependent enzyme n=2 Tax=Treponema parvum TaxID=138851 RepID=A0A975F1G0_9SPIR|nr:aminotransferase class I/II-fold pyridoxal phosphate-dependent enzyme [Treponema parvum]QTQ17000.1 aminotransferase class I/II-fold pyridoxal phosphate-dependent enzyme [Treponema parvum]
MLHPLAQELNATLKGTVTGDMLSDEGLRIYFPKGIIAQSAEAKTHAKTANATIGTTVVNGTVAILPCIQNRAPSLTPQEFVSYAPTAGTMELRNIWKSKLAVKNPGLAKKNISTPIVVPGLTAGIACIAELFLNKRTPLLIADPSWDNYALIVETRCGAKLHQFKMFKNGAFNIEGFEKAVAKEAKTGFVRLLLNFPQNPSGYSPTSEEAEKICAVIKNTAKAGARILVVSDDAYFGLNYEDSIEKQSLFAYLADIHENVLAVKIDGPTKEDFVWGFRCGFITFAWKGAGEAQYRAIEQKLTGLIRSTVSCCSTPAQSIILKAFEDPALEDQKAYYRKILEKRYRKVLEFVKSRKSKVVSPLPFNSGYFMSLHLNGVDAETLRAKLLKERGIGTISINPSTLRVAFSSLDENKIETVYSAIYEIAESLAN